MISPVSAPQRGQRPSSTRSGRSFSLSSASICLDRRLGELLDALDEVVLRAPTVLDVAEALLPVAGQLRRGQLVLLEHRDHLEALRRRQEIAAATLDVLAPDERLDRLGTVAGVPRPLLLHRLAQLLVVDRACPRFPSLRAASPRCSAAAASSPWPRSRRKRPLTSWPFSSGGSSALSGSFLLIGIGLNAVDATPPGLERDLAAGAEALVLDHGDDGRPRVARRRMEHGQEAAGDEIEDATLVGRELARRRARRRWG